MSTAASLRFDVIGLFPEIIETVCRYGVVGRALQRGTVAVVTHQLRDFTGGSPHPIDDGLVLNAAVVLDPDARPSLADLQAALAAYGPGAVDVLAPALRDAALSPEVRRAVPEVLARVGTQRAADLLLAELARRDEGMEQALVDALCRLRAERPDVRFRAKDVRPELLHLVRACGGLALAGDADGALSEGALSLRLKRVFDLLTLLHPAEDVVRIYQNIQRGAARSVDYALEHLDTMLDRELKALLLPLIEELTPEERADRLRRALRLK